MEPYKNQATWNEVFVVILLNPISFILGIMTSGCPSPTLKHNVGMAYVPLKHSKAGTKVVLKVYKKEIIAEVAKMPFVPANYFN